MKLLDPSKKKVVLNITPLIDVLFILIIFFTVSSTFLEQPGMKLELPTAQSATLHKVEKAVLTIGEGEKLFFRGDSISMESLPQVLQSAMVNSSDQSLIINADKRVEHGFIVSVMDMAKKNGVAKLVISTTPE